MEVWFYHLQRQPLAAVLPVLLDKAAGRNWRSVVQGDALEQIDALDDLLWTFSRDSFLPHAKAGDGDPERQVVYLTLGSENPNGAAMRLFVGKTPLIPALRAHATYERAILLFDGNDDDELAFARAQWTELKANGFTLAYWQQGERGGWEKKASHAGGSA